MSSKTKNDYFKYFTEITHKINSNIEKYTDTCYKTAMTMLIYFSRRYNSSIQKYTIKNTDNLEYFLNKILEPNQNILIDVEYHAETITKYSMEERFALVKKYNIEMIPSTFVKFAFHKPNIRFVSHAHNVLVLSDSITLAQSWLGLQNYHIFTNPSIHSRESLLIWLRSMYTDLGLDTRNFTDKFDPNYQYTDNQKRIIENNNKINEMIINEKIPNVSFIEIYYVVL